MICKNCGDEIRDNAKFCDQCGAVLTGDELQNKNFPFAIVLDVQENAEEIGIPPEEYDDEFTEPPEEKEDELSEEVLSDSKNSKSEKSSVEQPKEEQKFEFGVVFRILSWLLIGGIATTAIALLFDWFAV